MRKVTQFQTVIIPSTGTYLSTTTKTGRTVPGGAQDLVLPALVVDSLFLGLIVVNHNVAVVTVTLEGSLDQTNWVASLLTATAVTAASGGVPGQAVAVVGSTPYVVGGLLQNLWTFYRFKVVATNSGNVDCNLIGLS